ncbi:type I restriction endonuclease subunit M [Limnohabitans sp. 2KL-17]|uniref:class I SAM-dependent DNA methyltransferase n=1 Tax=Limnohabitans sp. 2KL-17 TaxID=1100704 RepID=UPI000D38808D|nr:class I SAM-dependent DNA methyltransferase [Limnohabitans sp. 2KL-17]PUE63176.1 type I restriction endonuclease subunit M [Limnohabitans sp. 2KL-17]
MFETTFRNLDDTLRKDAGCSSELDYIEQTSWVLFLKYLDDFEADREASAQLNGERYKRILSNEYAWTTWAVPKTADGKLDYNTALTGEDLKEFVDGKLFPYLKSFKVSAENADTLEYKIGEIFHELKNKLQSGYSLREVINKVDELRFRSNEEKHEMSSLYEDKIKNMGNAGRNGGEYYTPRPLIKTIVKVVNPKIGNKVYDGAVGSAGFLCEAYEYMRTSKQLTAKEFEQLQRKTFYGKEKKSLAYIIGVMNMILHGIEAPNIIHTNTLGENNADIQEKDRVDVVLANPPFGGKERAEVRQNFAISTGETAYLFLQHFIKILKNNGRGGIVIKSTFLTANDNASIALRKQLLSETSLDAVLILPKGVFTKTPATTVVLFFTKGLSTSTTWFYKLKAKESFGINNPISEVHLKDFVDNYPNKINTDNSWTVDISKLNIDTLSLPIRHPDANPYEDISPSSDIRNSLVELSKETQKLMEKIGATE